MPDDLRERVNTALRAFVETAVAEVAAIGPDVDPVAAMAQEFVLGGGKRLRPAFCYWGTRALGLADSDAVIAAAASLELLQACALVHDDVIDRSLMRRGQRSVHERFAAMHRDQGWYGDPAAFGNATAILLGDIFLVWSDAMLASSGVSDDALRRARPVHDSMRVEIMAGQYLDVLEQALGGGSVERALRVARFKAAKYTVERPLHLGSAIAGGDPTATAVFSAYGLPLGEAFQLRDDLLGVFGDPALTGKPAGDDLREGKRTVLIALAAEASGATDRAVIDRGLGNPSLDDAGVDDLREVITSSGAAARVESMIDERVGTAVTALETGRFEPVARDALVALAAAATRRNE